MNPLANPGDLDQSGGSAREFTIARQKLVFDVDLLNQSLNGHTEITIAPQSNTIRQIRLNCRQCDILDVTVDDHTASFQYHDPYRSVKPDPNWNIQQHHQFKDRLESALGENAREELIIELPKQVNVKEQGSAAGAAADSDVQQAKQSKGDTSIAPPETPVPGEGPTLQTAFHEISLKIDFSLRNVSDGLHFIGLGDGDNRYPSLYTRNSRFAGSACCLFPCLDDLTERCPWEIRVKCAKTLGSALGLSNAGDSAAMDGEDVHMSDVEDDFGLNDQERALDLAVVCSGQFEDESDDPEDKSCKVVTYSTQDIFCSANQVGFAVGPFEQVDLSDLREIDEDDKLAEGAVQVLAFCLPGRAAEVKNTALPMAKAIDFFTERYTKYSFSTYQMCFLDDLPHDSTVTAGMSFLSTRLLLPQDIIDNLYEVTHKVVHALAAQWSGICVTAREAADNWCIIGMAHYMTDMFMKSLCGNNEYRFRQKMAVDTIVELDRERPSLHALGALLQLDPSEYEFVALKSAAVLFILDRRLTKSSTSSGVTRIINRTLNNTKGGDVDSTLLSTSQFKKTCERTGHMKLDSFFNQWVEGAGCPNFRVSQRFNKKKLVVEMSIEQLQVPSKSQAAKEPPPIVPLNPDNFLRDVNEEISEVYANTPEYFTGPMTIRIHEADGTPYEHIVDISGVAASQPQKLEIPYNTKYKRLKRHRRTGLRDPSKIANAANVDASAEDGNDVLLYCLGDVLQSEEEVKDWRLSEWTEIQEKEMSEDSYEWIRMDADFEWICRMEINLSPWMHVSQLQQDRDVVAQFESLQYMGRQEPHPLISTFLTRTIMDSRYFHGIRTHAVSLLPHVAKELIGNIGLFHLQKIFSELCCAPGTFQARANDFSDRALYLVQCALPRALSRVRNGRGHVPMEVKRLFVDTLKFNDNSQNEFSDCHWVSTLMSCLADALVKLSDQPQMTLSFDEQDEEQAFRKDAIAEIERYRRIDEWISSYQNIYSRTALHCLLRLAKSDILQPMLADFLRYSRHGNADQIRLQAFQCLIDLGKIKHGPIAKWILSNLGNDPSPYVRKQLLSIFGRGLGQIAIGEHQPKKQAPAETDGLIIEEGTTTERAEDIARKTTVTGAMKALKVELKDNQDLAEAIWDAFTSTTLTLREASQLSTIPELLYEGKSELWVKLRYPRYWKFLRYDGDGKIVFKQTDKVRTQPRKSFAPPAPPSGANVAKADKPPGHLSRKPSMKINLSRPLGGPSDAAPVVATTTPAISRTPSLQITMPPPSQRPTPAPDHASVKTEGSPEAARRPSIGPSPNGRVVRLRVPKMRDPSYAAQLASIVPKAPAPVAATIPGGKLKLSTGGGIKREPASPRPLAFSPQPLGTPAEQRRASTASSTSSKRGQKRKSSERDTPDKANGGHGDHFTMTNGSLSGEPQAKRSKQAGVNGTSPAPASYAAISTPSQQFGAWDGGSDAPAASADSQFGAWDSGEKSKDPAPNGDYVFSPKTPGSPVPPMRKIVKLRMSHDRLRDAAAGRAGSATPRPAPAAPNFGPIESTPGQPEAPSAEFGAIDNGLENAAPAIKAEQPDVSDDDDDLPMAARFGNRTNVNGEAAKPADGNE